MLAEGERLLQWRSWRNGVLGTARRSGASPVWEA